MKKFTTILLILVGVVVIVLFAKDIIIKASVEKSVELVTGLKLNIGSLHVGMLKPVADIKDLVLCNPADFPDRTMLDMPEIYVNYDLPAIIAGTMHFPEVRLALKEFVVVKNAQGKLNLDALRSTSPSQKAPGKAPVIKIDTLKLSIGKVIYKDYSEGNTPQVKEFNINLNESYANIDSPNTLVNLIVVKALMHTSVAGLTNFDLKGLQGSVGGVLSGAQKEVSAAVSTAQEAGKQTSDTVKGLLKNPFESGK